MKEEEQAKADKWTQEQQVALELALLDRPPFMDKLERWTKIAATIEEKSMNQCIARYRFLKRKIMREKNKQIENSSDV